MSAVTATAAEARANFSKIATRVFESGKPVTILKNSKPWVTISPITGDSPVTAIDWKALDVVEIDPDRGYAVLPAEWDDEEDDGLYDDLA
ncbi:type II toxin-antitoxin system Phd/YefM family antitoxin [Xiamenia xianingshaonis]|uniref:Antitoxin n=1 Tax=Xiamenia xianingshaonis TaxID=2682776 RepID=A0A9E6MRN2_9ACTN|nr:type II toxin-antitoxin system Phd/YefM family antitoxin [Xiamenia xianingshaonis]QTU84709.1 hypothetical protein J7S26_01940 [Xiamenia xianingshaonis]